MRTLKGLVIGVVLLCVCWTMPAHATIDWSEGFEYADDTAMRTKWPSSCVGNPGVSTARPFSGSKSLRLVYRGKAGVDPGAGGCFMDRNLTSPSDTLYSRFYMYMENFIVDPVATKVMYHGPIGSYPSFWWGMIGSPSLSVSAQGITLENGQPDTVNVFGGPIPQNQWVCVETRLTMSDPGVDNGIIQTWVNGTQSLNKTNQRMRPLTTPSTGTRSPNAQFLLVRLYTQHGRGVIYYDDYAVSRDARIGCTASSSGDRQAPGAPSNFSFR